jgi:hypothetical protein
MTKLTEALAVIDAADKQVTWDATGECLVVKTEFFEKSGTSAGVIVRHFHEDNPPPVESVANDVTVGLTGIEAKAEGAQL